MTEKTSENLATILEAVGLVEMAALARADQFHDYKSELEFPEMELDRMLAEAADAASDPILRSLIVGIRNRHWAGDFDASSEESDAWAASEAGQETFRQFFEKKERGDS
jgi:hypothetical protein